MTIKKSGNDALIAEDLALGNFTRRQVLFGVTSLAALGAINCLGEENEPSTADDETSNDNDASDKSVPAWQAIPDQAWYAGVPVLLDLSSYCADPDGAALTFTLDQQLPAGLTLEGGVISGTPTAEFAESSFVASADNGL